MRIEILMAMIVIAGVSIVSGEDADVIPGGYMPEETTTTDLPMVDTDRGGSDYKSLDLPTTGPVPQMCEDICKNDPNCRAWTYVKPGIQGTEARCWLKSNVPAMTPNNCCISGVIKPKVAKIEKDSFTLEAMTSEDRKRQMEEFDKSWKSTVAANIGDFNRKIIADQENIYSMQTNRLEEDSKKLSVREDANVEYVKAPLQTERGIDKKQMVDPSRLMKPVKVNKVESLTTSPSQQQYKDSIFEGSYLLVHGENFGECINKCGIQLEYTLSGEKYEFVSVFPRFTKDLVPYQNDWNRSWFDNFIIARIPLLPIQPGESIHDATLTVWRGGETSFVNRYSVSLKQTGPGISYYNVAPIFDEGFISSGGEIWIYGTGFGKEPGKLYLDLTYHQDILELSSSLSENKLYLTVPAGGWSDNLIRANIPKITGTTGNYGIGTAIIHIKDKESNRDTFTYATFGPKMYITMISGNDFLEFDKKGNDDKTEEENNILVATHSPDCQWWKGPFASGNNGNDWFFKNKPLPKNVKLLRSEIRAINPDATSKELEYLFKELESWGKAIAEEGPAGFMKKFEEYLLRAISSVIDSRYGSYITSVDKEPTINDPSMTVHWENTCKETYAGVPNKYAATFMLYGPEGIV